MTGWSHRHLSDLKVILFRLSECRIPKEVEQSLLNKDNRLSSDFVLKSVRGRPRGSRACAEDTARLSAS